MNCSYGDRDFSNKKVGGVSDNPHHVLRYKGMLTCESLTEVEDGL